MDTPTAEIHAREGRIDLRGAIQVREGVRVIAIDAIQIRSLEIESSIGGRLRNLRGNPIDRLMDVAVRKGVCRREGDRESSSADGMIKSHDGGTIPRNAVAGKPPGNAGCG